MLFRSTSEMCPSLTNYSNNYSEQANALNNYGKPFPSPYSETYNPNWQNHPNFSWRQNQTPINVGRQPMFSQNQAPPGFRPPAQSYPNQSNLNQSYPMQSNVPQHNSQSNLQPAIQQQPASLDSITQLLLEMKAENSVNSRSITELRNVTS